MWYCLESSEDAIIAAARLSFQSAQNDESKRALVESLYFESDLFDIKSVDLVIAGFLIQIETTAFHMGARTIAVHVESEKEHIQRLLENHGYLDSSGYLEEGTTTMVLVFEKKLSDSAGEEGQEDEEENFSIAFDQDNPFTNEIASLMPTLFDALHKEYNR